MSQDKDVLCGWKAICQALGGISRKTALMWVRRFGLPVTWPATAPMASRAELAEWRKSGKGPRIAMNRAERKGGL